MVGAREDDKPQQGRDHMPGLALATRRRTKPTRLHDIPARHNAGAPESLRREEEAPVVLAAPRWTVVAHLHRVAHDGTSALPADGVELHPAARVAAGLRAAAIH